MSGIEKLYKLADAKPYKICNSCTDDNGNKITNSKNCSFRNLCGNACDEPHYILTAEKQLKLIVLLANREIRISPTYMCSGYRLNDIGKVICSHNTSTFENSLAQHINAIWQDLTEKEKQQVKGILE